MMLSFNIFLLFFFRFILIPRKICHLKNKLYDKSELFKIRQCNQVSPLKGPGNQPQRPLSSAHQFCRDLGAGWALATEWATGAEWALCAECFLADYKFLYQLTGAAHWETRRPVPSAHCMGDCMGAEYPCSANCTGCLVPTAH